jgi:hypothetical protein
VSDGLGTVHARARVCVRAGACVVFTIEVPSLISIVLRKTIATIMGICQYICTRTSNAGKIFSPNILDCILLVWHNIPFQL